MQVTPNYNYQDHEQEEREENPNEVEFKWATWTDTMKRNKKRRPKRDRNQKNGDKWAKEKWTFLTWRDMKGREPKENSRRVTTVTKEAETTNSFKPLRMNETRRTDPDTNFDGDKNENTEEKESCAMNTS